MTILFFLIIILFASTIIRPAYGLMVYSVIRLCIPHSARFLGFSLNSIVLAIIIVLSLPVMVKKIHSLEYIQKFFIKNNIQYLSVILFLIFVSSITAVVPFAFQFSTFAQFIYTEVLPSILFMLFFLDKKDYKSLNYVLAICVLLTTSYSIFTFLTSTNPLYEMLSTTTDDIQENAAKGRADLLGVGVGIMNNKITTSLISLLYFVYFWNKRAVIGFWLHVPVLVLSLIGILLTLQRSAIVCLLLFILYVIAKGGYKKKHLIWGGATVLFLLIIGYAYFSQYGDFDLFFLSTIYFWNDSYQDKIGVSGSSVGMRWTQLKTTFELAGFNILEGLGYHYSTYFDTELNLSNTSLGEKMMGFESIVFKEITSSGLIGLLAFFMLLYRQSKLMVKWLIKNKKAYYIAFVGSYLLAIIMTDHSGTIYLFYIFLCLNIIYSRYYDVEIKR